MFIFNKQDVKNDKKDKQQIAEIVEEKFIELFPLYDRLSMKLSVKFGITWEKCGL